MPGPRLRDYKRRIPTALHGRRPTTDRAPLSLGWGSIRGAARYHGPPAGRGPLVDWFIYVIRLHREIDRDRIIGRLAELGVPTRPYFAPIHLQPFYRSTFGFRPGDFPVTERVAASTLALPFSSRLSDEDVHYVADALSGVVDAEARG